MQPPDQQTLSQTFADPAAFSTSLVLGCIAAFGTESLQWSPQTTMLEVMSDYRVALPDNQLGKICTGIAIATTNRFWANLPDFVVMATAMCGGGYHPELFDPPDATDCAWALSEATLLERFLLEPKGPVNPEPSKDIKVFLGHVLDDEAIIHPPDALRLAIRKEDPQAKILDNWSDDEDIYSGIMDTEDGKTQSINSEIKARLQLLTHQLARLFRCDVQQVLERLSR